MELRKLGATDLKIAPLVLGGNVFGWTANRETSFAILDAFLAAGFNAVDTADVYNRYAPGLKGGESETIIGEWMKARGVRDRIVVITKGGLAMGEGLPEGLGREYLLKACEASLKRLQTDYIDVYMTHRADPKVPIADTLETMEKLMAAGKIRYAGCSNYAPDELKAAAAAGKGRARYDVFEPHYNLADRDKYEGVPEKVCVEYGLGVVAYYALASGFLTGKYRTKEDLAGSSRAHTNTALLNPRGLELLSRLDKVAARHKATPAQVALAWLMARPSVTAPIASATKLEQLQDILKAASVKLQPEDIASLDLP